MLTVWWHNSDGIPFHPLSFFVYICVQHSLLLLLLLCVCVFRRRYSGGWRIEESQPRKHEPVRHAEFINSAAPCGRMIHRDRTASLETVAVVHFVFGAAVSLTATTPHLHVGVAFVNRLERLKKKETASLLFLFAGFEANTLKRGRNWVGTRFRPVSTNSVPGDSGTNVLLGCTAKMGLIMSRKPTWKKDQTLKMRFGIKFKCIFLK